MFYCVYWNWECGVFDNVDKRNCKSCRSGYTLDKNKENVVKVSCILQNGAYLVSGTRDKMENEELAWW